MAYAKELTIALGQTVFAGDSQSEERITSQEARVEVTYVLERDDMDVPLLASVKAAEVHHALSAARQQLCRQAEPTVRQPEGADIRPAPSTTNGNGNGNSSPFKQGASAANSTATHPAGNARTNGAVGRQSGVYNHTTASPPAPTAPEDQAECITQAQKLAIRSMFTRLSMNEPQARALVHEQFGKWALEGLTKEEAKQLLQSLQQGEREHTGRD